MALAANRNVPGSESNRTVTEHVKSAVAERNFPTDAKNRVAGLFAIHTQGRAKQNGRAPRL